MSSNAITILHISDLHIAPGNEFDRAVVLDPLLERVRQDRNKGLVPELVIVSGDIAYSGRKEEYALAFSFLKDLASVCGLSADSFFIVPGNHDVDRKKYRPSDIPVYGNMAECNYELEQYADDLLKGMKDYGDFIQAQYPHLHPHSGRLIPFVTAYAPGAGIKTGLVGLNSAWMCRKSPDFEEIAIGEYQLKIAFKALENLGECGLVLCIVHHPLHWLWHRDRQITRQYVNNTVVLAGHLHEPGGGYIHDLDGSFFQFQAGGVYLGSESDWPSRYQYLTVSPETGTLRLDFRKFLKEKRRWVLDTAIGDDGVKTFPFMYNKGKKETHKQEILVVPESYRQWIDENYGYMDASKLYGKGEAYPLRLPEIFVPLFTDQPGGYGPGYSKGFEHRQPVDIETIIPDYDHLLIGGDPGSGKTTLLKHLACTLLACPGTEKSGQSDAPRLPVLIYLKEITSFFKEKSGRATGEKILFWYTKTMMADIITEKEIRTFLNAGRVSILLDGLDECEEPYRDRIVNAFCDLRIKYKGISIIITSRPHGITGAAQKRCKDVIINILPLDQEQVELFIRKWFSYFYPGSSGVGKKNAQAMIEEVRGHSTIGALISNPLMLTAVCILYHDGKELPEQRAELYQKFIDNMLYRRFSPPGEVHDFLKALAFTLHTKHKTGIDRESACGILETQLARKEECDDAAAVRKKAETLFDYLEPRCGLLKCEQDQYSFRHLTFQEFLTAQYMADNYSNHIDAIRPYWKDEWYREVAALYVSYLSIHYKKTANDIILAAIKDNDSPPYILWLLAGNTMLDIHYDRREKPVVKKIKDRLFTIIERQEDPGLFTQAGTITGWLNDPGNLKEFAKVKAGTYDLEGPGKKKIKAFEIGRYPVTNAWFSGFIDAGGYRNTAFWTAEGKKWLAWTKAEAPRFWNSKKYRCPNWPVVGVCWYEAAAFCSWLTQQDSEGYTYRLPTEIEWQAAAAGNKKRVYPWGNEWKEGHCNYGKKIGHPTPVGVYFKGDTPAGDEHISAPVSDLAGNVWEWTCTGYYEETELGDAVFLEKAQQLADQGEWDRSYQEYLAGEKGLPVLRGGAWFVGRGGCRCAYRYHSRPVGRGVTVGFRCARALLNS